MVAAVLAAGSEKAAAHRLGLSHSTVKHHLAAARSKVGVTTTAQLVWMLAPRLPEPEGKAQVEEWPVAGEVLHARVTPAPSRRTSDPMTSAGTRPGNATLRRASTP